MRRALTSLAALALCLALLAGCGARAPQPAVEMPPQYGAAKNPFTAENGNEAEFVWITDLQGREALKESINAALRAFCLEGFEAVAPEDILYPAGVRSTAAMGGLGHSTRYISAMRMIYPEPDDGANAQISAVTYNLHTGEPLTLTEVIPDTLSLCRAVLDGAFTQYYPDGPVADARRLLIQCLADDAVLGFFFADTPVMEASLMLIVPLSAGRCALFEARWESLRPYLSPEIISALDAWPEEPETTLAP